MTPGKFFRSTPANMVKGLTFRGPAGRLVIVALCAADRADYKKIADALGMRRADLRLAEAAEVEETLDMQVGRHRPAADQRCSRARRPAGDRARRGGLRHRSQHGHPGDCSQRLAGCGRGRNRGFLQGGVRAVCEGDCPTSVVMAIRPIARRRRRRRRAGSPAARRASGTRAIRQRRLAAAPARLTCHRRATPRNSRRTCRRRRQCRPA